MESWAVLPPQGFRQAPESDMSLKLEKEGYGSIRHGRVTVGSGLTLWAGCARSVLGVSSSGARRASQILSRHEGVVVDVVNVNRCVCCYGNGVGYRDHEGW